MSHHGFTFVFNQRNNRPDNYFFQKKKKLNSVPYIKNAMGSKHTLLSIIIRRGWMRCTLRSVAIFIAFRIVNSGDGAGCRGWLAASQNPQLGWVGQVGPSFWLAGKISTQPDPHWVMGWTGRAAKNIKKILYFNRLIKKKFLQHRL